MASAYLLALILSLGGLAVADWRFRLVFFANPRRAFRVLIASLIFFIVWDVLGIVLGIFYAGNSAFITGIFLAPEFPLEEIFFLTLLVYTTLIVWTGLQKL